ncbi:serine hydrolase [soil metagenome]
MRPVRSTGFAATVAALIAGGAAMVAAGLLLAVTPVSALALQVTAAAQPTEFDKLEATLRARVAETDGEVAVALMDLETGLRIGINEHTSMHAASTMKVPVLLELFRQVDAGRFAADDSIVVGNQFVSIADGSTYTLGTDRDTEIIEQLGQKMSLRRLASGMSIISSNLATNILIDVVTADSVQRTMASIGASDMRVLRGVSDDPAFRAGMNNTTTAAALARVLEAIARCELNTRASCDAMMEILEGQRFRGQIPAGLPDGVRIGNKTGSITAHRHDGAIIFPEGRQPYILVVLTRNVDSIEAANQVAVDVSRLVWQALAAARSD